MRPRGNEFGVFPKNIRGSVIFYYWVYDENGKRKFRSTGKNDFDAAVKFCRTLQIKGQLLNRTFLSFSTYTQDFFDYDNCPYINHRKARGQTYTRSWAKSQRRLLDTIIKPYFNQRSIDVITFHDIDMFIMSLKNQNYSNKKINHIITTLKNIFTYAEMHQVVYFNPCKNLKPFKIISPEKGILSKKEIETLFNEKNRSQIWPELIHFFINFLAAFSGLRLGEILALRPQNFNNDTLIISNSYSPDDGLKDTKNGKTRIIPLDNMLKTLFVEHCQGKRHDQYIFSYNDGKYPMEPKSIYRRFWKALEFIGIDKAERKWRNITFHSYRHGMNTRLLEAGVPPETVRLLTGHSASMTSRYSHVQLANVLLNQKNIYPDSIKNEINNNTQPSYIKILIDTGFLFPDGKRVKQSLDIVALEMHKKGIQPTERLLMELFFKGNGDKYSLKACKKAVIYANSM